MIVCFEFASSFDNTLTLSCVEILKHSKIKKKCKNYCLFFVQIVY